MGNGEGREKGEVGGIAPWMLGDRRPWRYYTVIAVILHCYTVSMHNTGNCNMVKSPAKGQGQGDVREFHAAEKWSPCFT